jgi:hypothetical protein
MSGKDSYQESHSVTIKKQDYRWNKNETNHDDNKINRRYGGFTPKAQKLKLAGKCSAGYAWYYVNGGDEPQHVLTPADTEEIRQHKLSCSFV